MHNKTRYGKVSLCMPKPHENKTEGYWVGIDTCKKDTIINDKIDIK